MVYQPIIQRMLRDLFLFLSLSFVFASCESVKSSQAQPSIEEKTIATFSIEELQKRTFQYFWDYSSNPFAQTHDRAPTQNFYSIAATGFGLTSYLIGAEKNYVTRQEAAERTLLCLEKMWQMPQHDGPTKVSGYKGFFYHFLTIDKAERFKDVELSTIDTGLLMAGVLSAQVYFDQENEVEEKIRSLADSLYRRVEWDWAMKDNGVMSMGWRPERGFIPAQWDGYNEAMILLIMAMGSPTHPIEKGAWEKWCAPYEWGEFEGIEHLNFSPLFGHQYSQMYIDFRGIQDAYMREKGIDYFENSRRATMANRAYCIRNPHGFEAYDSLTWGLTACDGPRDTLVQRNEEEIRYHTYWARGASSLHINDDGTLAPTAMLASIPFAPDVCLAGAQHMWNTYGDKLIGEYGFRDAFNLSYTYGRNSKNGTSNKEGWFDMDYIGIDQGPILIQTYNHQTEFVWALMKKSPYIVAGLKKAGFTGGWLDELN
ncbi:MAG: glucoamylase family protein [Bacteroidota bacterium]